MRTKDSAISLAALLAALALSACVRTRVDYTDVEPVEPPPPPVLAPTYVPAAVPETRTIDLPAAPVAPAPAAATPVPAPAAGASNIYVVKKGDALSKIAAAHGVRTSELMELNGISNANKVFAGQRLRLPDHAKDSLNPPAIPAGADAAKAASKAAPAAAADGTYVVKPGDALSKIAAAHGVKTRALMEANGIKDANKIRIGQKLKIPGASAEAAAPAAAEKKAEVAADEAKPEKKEATKKAEKKAEAKAPAAAEKKAEAAFAAAAPAEEPKAAASFGAQDLMMEYTVQSGDSVDGLAKLFVVSRDEIRRVNGLEAGQELSPGQRIKIPSAEP
jgi:LysM repeat protein